MNYLYGRSAAAMISAALAMRLYTGMAVDYPVGMNATWICPLVGLALYFPFPFALLQAAKRGNSSAWNNIAASFPSPLKRGLELLFALLLCYDTAANVRLTASSSNIIALGDVTVFLLIVPLAVVVFFTIILGGDAIGASARIALRILPLFALLVLLVQLPGYRFGWLTPWLGSGIPDILRGGVYCAGCMALLTLPWMLALPDRGNGSLLPYVAFPALGVSLLLLMQQMSAPVMPESSFTRAARIELVLSNGRMSLYPQFLLNLLWYGGLLYLLAAEAVSSAAFLHSVLPRLRIWILALAETIAVAALSIFNPAWLQNSAKYISGLFPLLGGLVALPLLYTLIKMRGDEI